MHDAPKVTLLNPHADDFVRTPVSFWIVRRRGLGKYRYLIDEQAGKGGRVDVLIDGTLSAVFGQRYFVLLPRWLRIALLKLEILLWLRINGLADKVNVHWSAATIADRKILYIFSYKCCAGVFSKRKSMIDKFEYKIVNLSHYFIRTKEKAGNIASLQRVVFAAESDLRKSEYFRHFFPVDRPFIVLPFAVNERFKSKVPFAARKKICAATGSFHNLYEEEPAEYYKDFITFFDSDTYHPVRKALYYKKPELKEWLDSRISYYHELSGRRGPLARLIGYLGLDVAQSEYFSFDIVDFYNAHQFAIVGEELAGLPVIGFFEAMACGCVMLGQADHFYVGLGLEPGIHYLTHDGSIEDIHRVIAAALEDPAGMARISSAGLTYVAERCSPSAIHREMQKKIASLIES